MNKLLPALFTIALGFGVTLPAYANHDGMGDHCKMHSNKTFEDGDADHDGTVDRDEVHNFMHEHRK